MWLSYKGSGLANEAAPLVAEYNHRSMLKKLGYSFDVSELSSYKAECFSIIAGEIADLQAKEMKKGKRGHKT